jgi:Zn-dependent peptidase ImmA (M78 family)
MSIFRDTVLEATLEAAQLHSMLGSESSLSAAPASIDIFKIIENQNIFLFFKKLDGLLGAYLPVETDPGILVTTQRSLAIQRFTAAHELGHAVLRHGLGIDDDQMLSRTPFGGRRYDAKEMGADTFAAMFLMPEWLINAVATQQEWDYHSIRRPENVYQMSLRLGVSYEALTRTLVRHAFLTVPESVQLLRVPVKSVKQSLVGAHREIPVDDWRCNVWLLTEHDEHAKIIGEPEDLFVVRLREKSTAGYLWNMEQVREAGFNVVSDRREVQENDLVGGDVLRILTAQSVSPLVGDMSIPQSRPWDPTDTAGKFEFSYDLKGREVGVSRFFRQKQLAA